MTGKNKVATGEVKFYGHACALPDYVEEELVEHCLTFESMYFGLRINDLRRLAFDVAKANSIEHCFNKETRIMPMSQHETLGAEDDVVYC